MSLYRFQVYHINSKTCLYDSNDLIAINQAPSHFSNLSMITDNITDLLINSPLSCTSNNPNIYDTTCIPTNIPQCHNLLFNDDVMAHSHDDLDDFQHPPIHNTSTHSSPIDYSTSPHPNIVNVMGLEPKFVRIKQSLCDDEDDQGSPKNPKNNNLTSKQSQPQAHFIFHRDGTVNIIEQTIPLARNQKIITPISSSAGISSSRSSSASVLSAPSLATALKSTSLTTTPTSQTTSFVPTILTSREPNIPVKPLMTPKNIGTDDFKYNGDVEDHPSDDLKQNQDEKYPPTNPPDDYKLDILTADSLQGISNTGALLKPTTVNGGELSSPSTVSVLGSTSNISSPLTVDTVGIEATIEAIPVVNQTLSLPCSQEELQRTRCNIFPARYSYSYCLVSKPSIVDPSKFSIPGVISTCHQTVNETNVDSYGQNDVFMFIAITSSDFFPTKLPKNDNTKLITDSHTQYQHKMNASNIMYRVFPPNNEILYDFFFNTICPIVFNRFDKLVYSVYEKIYYDSMLRNEQIRENQEESSKLSKKKHLTHSTVEVKYLQVIHETDEENAPIQSHRTHDPNVPYPSNNPNIFDVYSTIPTDFNTILHRELNHDIRNTAMVSDYAMLDALREDVGGVLQQFYSAVGVLPNHVAIRNDSDYSKYKRTYYEVDSAKIKKGEDPAWLKGELEDEYEREIIGADDENKVNSPADRNRNADGHAVTPYSFDHAIVLQSLSHIVPLLRSKQIYLQEKQQLLSLSNNIVGSLFNNTSTRKNQYNKEYQALSAPHHKADSPIDTRHYSPQHQYNTFSQEIGNDNNNGVQEQVDSVSEVDWLIQEHRQRETRRRWRKVGCVASSIIFIGLVLFGMIYLLHFRNKT